MFCLDARWVYDDWGSDRLFVGSVFLYHQVLDDEILSVHRILSHVVFQHHGHLVALVECYLIQSDVRSDEIGELIGTDFSQSFEACDFRIRTHVFYGLQSFFLRVAVLDVALDVAVLDVAFSFFVVLAGAFFFSLICYVIYFTVFT